MLRWTAHGPKCSVFDGVICLLIKATSHLVAFSRSVRVCKLFTDCKNLNCCILLVRHVARLRRLGVTKIFRGGDSYCHRTQLTITITDSATTMKIGVYKTMLRAKRAKKFFGLYPNCNILGYISRKWSQKIFKWLCLGARRQFGEQFPRVVPLPGYVTATRESWSHDFEQQLDSWSSSNCQP